MNQSWRSIVLLLVVALAVTSCLADGNPMVGEALADQSPAGFFMGWWHGFTVLFSFVGSLFTDTVGVYEVRNSGWPYNLGYVFGVMMFFSGGGAGATSKKKK